MLDGTHRQEACANSGREPRYVPFKGQEVEALSYVVSRNMRRRHLTTSQKSMVGAKLIKQMELAEKNVAGSFGSRELLIARKPGRPAEGGEKTAVVATALGVSQASVKRARKILKESPEKAEKIAAGKLTVGKAAQDASAAEKKKAAREAAISRIGKICGKALANAVRDRARLKTSKDVVAFADQSDDDMKAQAGLIEIGWGFQQAKLYRSKKLTLRHSLNDLAVEESRELRIIQPDRRHRKMALHGHANKGGHPLTR